MQTKTHTNLDPAFRWLTLASGLAVLLLVSGILYTLVIGAMPALKQFGFGFLVSQSWDPAFKDFGALSSVYGTLVSTAIGMLIAVPLSLVIALFLVELAPPGVSRLVGGAIELLAAIPSIIYGMWDCSSSPRSSPTTSSLGWRPWLPASRFLPGRQWGSACSQLGSSSP